MKASRVAQVERRIVHVAVVALCLAGFTTAAGSGGVAPASALLIAGVTGVVGAVSIHVLRSALRRAWARLTPRPTAHVWAATEHANQACRVLVESGPAGTRGAA